MPILVAIFIVSFITSDDPEKRFTGWIIFSGLMVVVIICTILLIMYA